MRRASLSLLSALMLLCTFPALAEDGSTMVSVTRTMDFFVTVTEPVMLQVATDLCPGTEDYWCPRPPFQDSVLWVFDESGQVLAANDDDPRRNGQSWNSYIGIELQPGVYRLRAGRFGPCDSTGCLHPEQPFDEGCAYDLISNLPLLLDPEPPQLSPPPIPSELPTEAPTITPNETETPQPSPIDSAQPSPIDSASPEPSPTPSVEASPSPVEPSPTPSPSPAPPSPSPSPSAANPTPTPTEPPPTPTEPPPVPTDPPPSPTEAPPTPIAPPPTDAPPPDPVAAIGEAAAAIADAVGAAAEAVGEAAKFVGDLGKDLTPAGRKVARTTIIPAVVVTQIANAAVAAAGAAMATRPNTKGKK